MDRETMADFVRELLGREPGFEEGVAVGELFADGWPMLLRICVIQGEGVGWSLVVTENPETNSNSFRLVNHAYFSTKQ